MVEIKTAGEIQAMRAAGQVVAQILAAVQDQAKAGPRTPPTRLSRPGALNFSVIEKPVT